MDISSLDPSEDPRSGDRARRWIGVGVFLLAAGLGHVFFWYLARARPAAAPVEGPAARLLADESFSVVAWVPYPHQNLEWLKKRSGLDAATWAAVARLAGLETDVPSFGTMAIAPASDLVVGRSTSRRWALRARVYPTVAAFARLSGHLATNPWLSGGAVRVDGQPVQVAWDGRWWQVETGAPGGVPGRTPAHEPVLALIRLGREAGSLPAGLFGLRERGGALELRSEGLERPALRSMAQEDLNRQERILVAVGDPGAREGPRQMFALLAAGEEHENDLPRAVRVSRPDVQAWPLPGSGLLQISGRDLPRAVAGAWNLLATDARSLAEGNALVETVSGWGEREALHVQWALWVDLRAAHREVARLKSIVDQLPFFGRRTRRRWHDAETVLASLSGSYRQLEIIVGRRPDALWVRLDSDVSSASRD